MASFEIDSCQGFQFGLFAASHTLFRCKYAQLMATLDLDKDARIIPPSDNVDLSCPASPVTVQESVAVLKKIASGDSLAARAHFFIRNGYAREQSSNGSFQKTHEHREKFSDVLDTVLLS